MSRHLQMLSNYRLRLLDRVSNLDPNLANQIRDLKLDWYSIKNDAEPLEPENEALEEDRCPQILIYDEIGGSFGISADAFVSELNEITASHIDVRINSPGGSLFDAIAIYNALVAHPAHITTYVDALAASAASIIALSGDEVVTMVGAQWMIHDALGTEMGNAKDMKAMSTFLDRQSDNIASIYAEKAGGTVADWRAKMLAETWMFANEAVELGLSDRVFKAKKKTMPDEDMPEEEEMPHEEDEEEETENAFDVEALMHKRHALTNRGFKYTGRRRAPNPVVHSDPVLAKYLQKIGSK